MGQPESKNVGTDYLVDITGYTNVTIYRWIKAGYLPTPHETRPVRWPKHTIDEWLNENFDL